MSPKIPVTIVLLLVISGFMQQRISKYFENGEYSRERLLAKYSGYACYAFACLFIIMNFFI